MFYKKSDVRPATLFKKETVAQVFSFEFCEISKNTFNTEHFGRLLLVHLIKYSDEFKKVQTNSSFQKKILLKGTLMQI